MTKKKTWKSIAEGLRVDLEKTQQELREADTALIKAVQDGKFEAGYQQALVEVQDFLKQYANDLPIELWAGSPRALMEMFAKRAAMHISVFKPLSLEVVHDAKKDADDAEDDEEGPANGSTASV